MEPTIDFRNITTANKERMPQKDFNLTNEEFFKQNSCMYFTDEVKISQKGDAKFVNEF